jgi:hypothetical protein
MDVELLDYLAAMENRLVARINNGNEGVLNRLTVIESELRNLRSEHAVTRNLVTSLPATVLNAIEQALLNRMSGLEAA